MQTSFAGCAGGLHGLVTPGGKLSVTSTSSTVQATAPVTLNVQ